MRSYLPVDRVVIDALGPHVGERVVQAARNIQEHLAGSDGYLRIVSAYHYYLGALNQQAATRQLHRHVGRGQLAVESDIYRHALGDFLVDLLDRPRLLRTCRKAGIIPLSRHPRRTVFGVRDLASRDAALDLARALRLPHPDLVLVPDLCFLNYYDTVEWCLAHGLYGRHGQAVPVNASVSTSLSDAFLHETNLFWAAHRWAQQMTHEALLLGSSRLARRLLRFICIYYNCSPDPSPRYLAHVREMTFVMVNALDMVRPAIPLLVPVSRVARAILTSRRPTPFLLHRARDVALSLLNQLTGTQRHLAHELRHLIRTDATALVFGASSLVLRGTFVRAMLDNAVGPVVFIMPPTLRRRSSFHLTSRGFITAAVAARNGPSTRSVSLGAFLRTPFADPHDHVILVGAAHLRKNDVLCERETVNVLAHAFPAQIVAVAGRDLKDLLMAPAGQLALRQLFGDPDYWRHTVRTHAILPDGAFRTVL